MINDRPLHAITVALLAWALLVSASNAEPPMPPDRSPGHPSTESEDQDHAVLPSAASMVAPQISSLEQDIAQLVQKRDSMTPTTLPWLELQIDSRIVLRWLLMQTAKSTEQSSMQINGYLHGTSMSAILPAIDDYASKQAAIPNSIQAVGTQRIHQLTYDLKDATDSAALDAAAAEVAQDILIAITPMQAGNSLPALAVMRPTTAPTSAPAEGSTAEQGGPRTVDELASLARQASVSPPLRRQLIAMAALAQKAASDPDHTQEAQAIRKELQRALDLSAGLQANTAVTTEERGQIESQLCDGLALFSDPRLRGAGQARLASLDQYRQLLGRVDKMRVPPELKDALSPALSWAHENPDQGDKVLSAVEKFLPLYLHHEARPEQPDELAALRPNDPLRRAYEAVNKQFDKARSDFLANAADVGGSSNAPRNGTVNGSGIEALNDHVNEMTSLEKLSDVLIAMPKTIQSLDAFRPRPSGGIMRRVNALAVLLASPLKSAARDEAPKQLTDLHDLAATANELAGQTVAQVPPSIAQAYSGDQLAALETKWKSVVIEMASAFAANQPIDLAKLDRLKAVRGLVDALGPATAMEAAFAKPEALTKWADWTATPDQIHALLAPYQQAMSQAFTGFVSDRPDQLAVYARLQPQYAPMIAMLTRTGGYADACATLPDGTVGLLSRLATRYAKAPFADQRFASLIAALTASAGGDSAVSQTAAATISNRVSQ